MFDRQIRVVLALRGLDGWRPVIVDNRSTGDFVDYWWSARIPTVRYSFGGPRLVSARGDRICRPFAVPPRHSRGLRPQGRGLIPARRGLTAHR
jgi:hypothetical protein